MTSLARHPWFEHPLAAALLRFNLLPSRLFHPSRVAEWLPPAAAKLADWPALHRHASGALLRRLGWGMVQSLEDEALPIAMADEALFEHLILYSGLVVLGPALRRVIVRADLLALGAQLGQPRLEFAQRRGAQVWPGEGAPLALRADVHEQVLRLGAGLLSLAMEAAHEDVGRRGRLRLPVDAQAARLDLPEALTTPAAALAVARGVLEELDPQWLSSFPAPR